MPSSPHRFRDRLSRLRGGSARTLRVDPGVAEPTPLRGFRLRALLAAGLVLGIGATATLASWTSVEYGTGSFTGSRFRVVAASDGTTAASHPTSPGLTLTMSLSQPGKFWLPGTSGYAWVDVTTTPETDVTAAFALTSHSGTAVEPTPKPTAAPTRDIRPWLTYRMVAIGSTLACDATRFDPAAAPSWITSGDGAAARPDLPFSPSGATVVVAAHGTQASRVCVQVSLAGDAPAWVQGMGETMVWGFTSTSIAPR